MKLKEDFLARRIGPMVRWRVESREAKPLIASTMALTFDWCSPSLTLIRTICSMMDIVIF